MLLSGRKRCPQLAEFLDQYVTRVPMNFANWPGAVAVFGGIMLSIFGLGGHPPFAIAPAVPIGLGVVLIVLGLIKLLKPTPLTLEEQRHRDAWHVAYALQQLITRNRIHRDLDSGSIALFEEAARLWLRIRAALDSAALKDRHLPPTYAAVRDRIAQASQEAMVDMLLAYRLDITKQPSNWTPLEFVDEALDNFGIRKSFDDRQPPPAFYGARQIAEKLQVLADETEALALERLSTPVGPNVPSRSIDAVLGELRSIRQAEDELRQDLGNR